MQASILYVQSNEQLAKSIKDRLNAGEVEFVVVDSAAEAFKVYEERRILLTLVDAGISDMKMTDFIIRSHKQCPDMIYNVYLDVADSNVISSVTRSGVVRKIFLMPCSLEEIIEGIQDSIDCAMIEQDYEGRKKELELRGQEFEKTLERLKTSLVRQQHSYNKINPFFTGTVEAFCEISDRDKQTKEYIKEACKMLLKLETTGALKPSDYEDALRKIIDNELDGYEDIAVGSVKSCFAAGVGRNHLVNIAFASWLIVRFECMLGSKGTIDIDSRFVTSTKCEFSLTISGYSSARAVDEGKEISQYILAEIEDMSDICDVSLMEGNKQYIIRITI